MTDAGRRTPGRVARWAIVLAILLGAALGAARPAAGQEPSRGLATGGIAVADIGFTVSDLDRSIGFFTEVLGFELVERGESDGADVERLTGVFGARLLTARLRLGREVLELTQYLAPEGRPAPVDGRANDHWFQHVAIVVRDMDEAYRVLRRARVRHASTGPQTLPMSNPAAGGIRAFYFKDPDGHHLELIWFPPGKGDPRWQTPSTRLFLGIDHTAIVVADTERSLRFYRDLLGFAVAGQSRNFGLEQERLNNVEGASLRITGLRLRAGPGVELLEYLSPRGGRPYPADARPNDLVHWQTTVSVEAGQAVDLVATSGMPLVSRGPSGGGPEPGRAFRRGVVVRDPDGHAVRVVEP